jgi:hypothetical protein
MFLLQKWIDFTAIREAYRSTQVAGETDLDKQNTYISSITSMWLELYPIVKGDPSLKDLEEEFLSYEHFYYDPGSIVEGTPEENEKGEVVVIDIYKMDHLLRKIMDKLHITDI